MHHGDSDEVTKLFYSDRVVEQDKRFDFQKEDLELMLNRPHIFQYVCEDENEIVGYILGYDMGAWGFIDILIVSSTHRNMSIGTLLINHLVDNNKHWKVVETACYSKDTDSIQFIKNRGFDIEQTLVWLGKSI